MDEAEAIATVANSRNMKMTNARLRAAYMYYVEGLTQNEIAERLGIGRVTVVRHLNEARRKREVRFEIETGISDCVELELRLERAFGLDKAIVVPDSGDPSTIRDLIGFSTGAFLSDILVDGISIGVSWGKTLSRALVTLAPRTLQDASVVSLLGGIFQARAFNPSEFAWQVAAAIGAECYMLTAPAIVDSPQTKQALMRRCGLDHIVARAARTDVVVISVGAIDERSTALEYSRHMLSIDLAAEMKKAGAIGDMFFNFFDRDGRLVDHPVNERIMSVPIDSIRGVPMRIMASGGLEKVPAIRAGMSMMSANVLITNEGTAKALIEG